MEPAYFPSLFNLFIALLVYFPGSLFWSQFSFQQIMDGRPKHCADTAPVRIIHSKIHHILTVGVKFIQHGNFAFVFFRRLIALPVYRLPSNPATAPSHRCTSGNPWQQPPWHHPRYQIPENRLKRSGVSTAAVTGKIHIASVNSIVPEKGIISHING